MEEQKEHKRRVRYKGTHPRNYNEKYKELNPEKYQGTIEHVIQKGSTPAGMHIPILVDEILDFLKIEPGQNGLDATLGYGGHSSRMLACLQGKGHLCALDVDPIEMAKTKERLAAQGYGPEILTILHQNFANIDQVAAKYGPFDFILADLGVSSMQIDNPERGFSYKYDGPLDLRLNPEAGISAAERLRTVARDELEGMLIENADEPYAKEISKAVTRALRKGKKIDTTFALRDLIAEALDFLPKDEKKEAIKKSCARTFQALRIDVNNEYEVLEAFMEKLPDALAPGGRAAILTFHSGEDRLVKKSMKGLYQIGIYSEYSKEVIRPSKEECALDVDPIEMAKTKERLAAQGYGPEILTILHQNFANIDQVAAKYGPFDFILADLGVSSMQIDNPERGFSYKYDGPLDLRLNPEAGISAAERLRTVARDELEGMLIENADEPYAKEISKAVTRALRKGKKIDTTFALRDLIAEALDFLPKDEKKEAIKKSCARTFQALRIDVNNEYEVLEAFMEKLPDALAPGGRAAILTFHSGEDRLVKKSMKGLYQIGIYSEYSKEVIRPSKEECIRNSRASSTKMRWAIKAE